MFVHVSSVAVTESVMGHAGLGWHIVRTLTDSIAAAQGSHDNVLGGYPTVIDFSWVRGARNGG
jgi:serine/threonine-protein kinase RsbW